MRQKYSVHTFVLCAFLVITSMAAQSVLAQTTVFTYQGKLDFDGVPANGQFDFQFKLFDALTDGSQHGGSIEQLNLTVSNGEYKVNLDFGAAAFNGADRYLEVSYRPSGGSSYTPQTLRQQITSAPYAIRSLVADGLSTTCEGCVTSTQIQSVQGGQVSGAIPVGSVPPGSINYIQNSTSQQAASNFNISGSGTAGDTLSGNVINAATQYNIGGSRALSTAGAKKVFAGISAGAANSTGQLNSFFGNQAGLNNTTGSQNTLVGSSAGWSMTTGDGNSFFGNGAGFSSNGNDNAFFGNQAGFFTTGLGYNAFFGYRAGFSNTTGNSNSFLGYAAGYSNTTGRLNSFFGAAAGQYNTTGEFNSFYGYGAGAYSTTGSNNTFIGDWAGFVTLNSTGDSNTLLGHRSIVDSGVSNATAIGASAHATSSHTVVLGTDQEAVIIPGKLELDTLGTAGSQQLCLNSSKRLAPCSSSLRYKTDLRPFSAGLSIINRLQPVSFTWKEGGMRDLGFGAEDVQKVEPLLVTFNSQGQVEGVKYDRVAVVLVNALKEQQAQIEQRSQIEGLKKLICLDHPNADICK